MNYEAEREARQEEEANYFAMCLLMPEKFLREAAKGLEIDIVSGKGLKALADKFDVSEPMMLIRIMQLGMIGGLGVKGL